MVGFEEETYSTIFTSLNHSVRRKIIKMLSEEPRTFSDMFESLGISSSHFNYHLDNLGDLVSKTEDGKYKLSYLGEAAVATISKVEDSPKNSFTKHPSLFFAKNWKPIILVVIVMVAILGGAYLLQYNSLAELSNENNSLYNSNELLWDRYTSLLVNSEHSPPISKETALEMCLSGEWDAESLQGMIVDASLVVFKFGTEPGWIVVNGTTVKKEVPIARMYEVTEKVSDYSPVEDETGIYHYVWEITVRPVQDYLDKNFSSQPSGIYHVDADSGEYYPTLYQYLYN